MPATPFYADTDTEFDSELPNYNFGSAVLNDDARPPVDDLDSPEI